MNYARQQYLQVLHSLDPLARYTDLEERMRILCPHLAPKEIESILGGRGTMHFALPPVKVQDSFHTASFTNDQSWQPHISMGTPGRSVDYYAYSAQALAYAGCHWPEQLIEDTWVDVQKIVIANPRSLDKRGRPTQIGTVHVGLNQAWANIDTGHSVNLQLWDDAIHYATTSWVEGGELTGLHRSVITRHNCAHCGGGLGKNQCNGCGITYSDLMIGDWDTPLASRLVALLEAEGYSFALHPSYLY